MKTLFFTLWLSLLPLAFAQAACQEVAAGVIPSIHASNLPRLQNLLAQLRKNDCPARYITQVARATAQLAAQQAGSWLAKDPQRSRALLAQVPVETWETQELRGELAALSQQWNQAARYYNRALDMLDDPRLTPKKAEIPIATLRRISNHAAQAQLLANHLAHTLSRSGVASGVLRGKTRNFQAESIPLPVQFNTGKAQLSASGREAATRLAAYLKRQAQSQITLTGHADERGDDAKNQVLSERRVATLRQFLKQAGVQATIDTRAYGEDLPLVLDNPSRYSQPEIWQMNRRVELKMK